MSREPYDEATKATAEQGEVQLDGPDGVATSMTPGAAKKTAAAIDAAADEAAEQVARNTAD